MSYTHTRQRTGRTGRRYDPQAADVLPIALRNDNQYIELHKHRKYSHGELQKAKIDVKALKAERSSLPFDYADAEQNYDFNYAASKLPESETRHFTHAMQYADARRALIPEELTDANKAVKEAKQTVYTTHDAMRIKEKAANVPRNQRLAEHSMGATAFFGTRKLRHSINAYKGTDHHYAVGGRRKKRKTKHKKRKIHKRKTRKRKTRKRKTRQHHR